MDSATRYSRHCRESREPAASMTDAGVALALECVPISPPTTDAFPSPHDVKGAVGGVRWEEKERQEGRAHFQQGGEAESERERTTKPSRSPHSILENKNVGRGCFPQTKNPVSPQCHFPPSFPFTVLRKWFLPLPPLEPVLARFPRLGERGRSLGRLLPASNRLLALPSPSVLLAPAR